MIERFAGEWYREILGIPQPPESERHYFSESLRPAVRPAPAPRRPQGPCATTGTPRFENPACRCNTYPGNLGPCAAYEEGRRRGHCVYCDHTKECHHD